MYDIAYRITGMSKIEFLEHDIPRVVSREQVFIPRIYGALRHIYRGLVFPEDLDEKREKLKKNVPDCLVSKVI